MASPPGASSLRPGPFPGSSPHPSARDGPAAPSPNALSKYLWSLRIPLLITHASSLPAADDDASAPPPFMTSVPRFSYLALLLPRLSAFFGRPCSSFHHEDVLLRNHAVGLLADLYAPQLPWRLTVGDGAGWDIGDTFINGVKEADFVRFGTARGIMSLSKDDTTKLWEAVVDNDYASFARVNTPLLNPALPLRHIPVRIYVPTSTASPSQQHHQQQQAQRPSPQPPDPAPPNSPAGAAGAFKVLQALIPARSPPSSGGGVGGGGGFLSTPPGGGGAAARGGGMAPTLVGPALRSLLPSLFPSSRDPVLAGVVLHGAQVPFGAPLEELMREAAYPDGWLCLIVVLL